VVNNQLQVERRTGKVRQSETDVLPLCHATNLDEARHIKFGLQIERKALHMLTFCSVGVHLRSRDLLKFLEISANISETVQDRHIVTVLINEYGMY